MPGQQELFAYTPRPLVTAFAGPNDGYVLPGIATTQAVSSLLAQNAAVGIGISGGKDSSAMAHLLKTTLDARGHTGPRILIHADLGRAEWGQSLSICQQLAWQLEMELVTVSRSRGDMVDRWYQRWHDNAERYANLQLVKMLLPWSTAGMRFCTSELKSSIIARELVRRFPNQPILSTTGIRRQESINRKNKPVASVNNALTNKTANTSGFTWNPLIEWSEEDVWALHHRQNLPIHEAYTTYRMSRVSCAFCVLSSLPDLTNAASCRANHALFAELVNLEITSTFSFQDKRWLADVCPSLLTDQQHAALIEAKHNARARQRIEAAIPAHLLYEEGWPRLMPTYSEAVLLGQIRREVSRLIGISINYDQPQTILDRYAHLMAEGRRKQTAGKNARSGALTEGQPESLRQKRAAPAGPLPSLFT